MIERLVKHLRYDGFEITNLAKRATKHDPSHAMSSGPFAADHARFSSCCLHPAACCTGCWTELAALSTKRLYVTGKATRGTVPAGQSDRIPGDFLPWERSLTSRTQQWESLRPRRSREGNTHLGGIQGTHRGGEQNATPSRRELLDTPAVTPWATAFPQRRVRSWAKFYTVQAHGSAV